MKHIDTDPTCPHGFSGNGAGCLKCEYTATDLEAERDSLIAMLDAKIKEADRLGKRLDLASAMLDLQGWEFYEGCWIQKATGVVGDTPEPPRCRACGGPSTESPNGCDECQGGAALEDKEPVPPVYTPLEELLREENYKLRVALREMLNNCPECEGSCLYMYDSAADGYARECDTCPRYVVMLAGTRE